MAERDGGLLRDSQGRPILKNVAADAPKATTDILMAGTLVDADGKEVVAIEGVGVGDGAAWSASAQLTFGGDTNLYRSAADVLQTDDSLYVGGPRIRLTAAGAELQFLSDSAGSGIRWGANADVNLYRGGADILRTDDSFRASGGVIANLGAATQINLNTGGVLTFGVAEDTNLYRSAADYLQTDDSFRTARELRVNWDLVVNENNTSRVYFGSALDTNLYREFADTLRTDDNFYASLDIVARRGAATSVALGARGPASESGIGFALDTNLYRSGVGDLAMSGDLRSDRNGGGLVVKSPDGLVTRRIRIDNAGAVVAVTV